MNGAFIFDWAAGRRFQVILTTVLCLLGAVYVGNAWSPSSYAFFIESLQVEDNGLVAGSPRAIRVDEYLTYTPLMQASVNNSFTRYNESSLYREDMRGCLAFPIADWGALFKPTLWGFFVLDPAHAYSLHFYALMVLFVVGYMRLFQMMGGTPLASLLAALVLFLTSFMQGWWGSNAPTFALFPWLLACLDFKWSWTGRAVLFYWLACCWMIGLFYPPFMIPQAFVGLLFLICFRPDLFRKGPLLKVGVAAVAACATVVFYLRDYISAIANTLYPGKRVVEGGADLLWVWPSHLFPTALIQGHQSTVVGVNVCEIGVIGSFYLLAVLCFAHWEKLRGGGPVPRLPFMILGAGVLAVGAWMYLPLPGWVGVPLLWDRVRGDRMRLGMGLLLFLLAFLAANRLELKLSWQRFAGFAALVLGGWLIYKPLAFAWDTWLDWVVLVPLAALVAVRHRLSAGARHRAVLAVCVVLGAVTFGTFNPLQSAWPIFHREQTPVTRRYDRFAAENGGVVYVPGFQAAAINGLGYRSLNACLMTPQIDFWKKLFPELSEEQLNQIFNRNHHVLPREDFTEPMVVAPSSVVIPISRLREVDWARFRNSETSAAGISGNPATP